MEEVSGMLILYIHFTEIFYWKILDVCPYGLGHGKIPELEGSIWSASSHGSLPDY